MKDVVFRLAGIDPDSPLAEVVAKRADIFELTEKTHDAALRPSDPGGLSPALRAALACRIAKLNGDEAFVRHFEGLLDQAGGTSGVEKQVADLASTVTEEPIAAMIRHCDLVAKSPKEATGQDIERLRRAGVSEPDIVRLSELVAFVSYQIRVVAGLRLMRQAR